MRRLAIVAALIGAGVLVARALAPRLHARLMAGCERMFEQMPDSSPPKRMLRGMEEIRVNSGRTLALLETREQQAETLHETSPAGQRARRIGAGEQEELAGVGVSGPQRDLPLDA